MPQENPCINQIEDILPKIHKLQDFMVYVATTVEVNLDEVSEIYSEIYLDVDCSIELLVEDGIAIKNPNHFKTLSGWKSYYNNSLEYIGDRSKSSVRREYIYDLYTDFVEFIEDYLQHEASKLESAIDANQVIFESLENILKESQKIQSILISIGVRTSDIDTEKDGYRQSYQNLISSIRVLQHGGIAVTNPNQFSSLWYWHSYYSSSIPTYAERRKFVGELYTSLVSPIQKALYKQAKKLTSTEELIQDLKNRFKSDSLDASSVSSCLSVKSTDNVEVKAVNVTSKSDIVSDLTTSLSISNPSIEPMVDFVIITTKDVEKISLLEAFEIDEDEDRVFKDSRCYWRKRICLKDNNFYEIAIIQLIDMANVNAAIFTVHAVTDWNPSALLMVGIAAAASNEQNLGDVIVSSDIYYYERSKETDSGTLLEPQTHKASASLCNRFNSLSTKTKETFAIGKERPDQSDTRPKVSIGVIASGEKIIAKEALRQDIQRRHRKIHAIEMEGYGLANAAWQNSNHWLVIKALSDYADSNKNDEWQPYAAAVAAGFTKAFLLDTPLPPRNPSVQ